MSLSPPPLPPRAEKAVAVLGRCQGTGAFITPSTVLTCAHVIGSGHNARVVTTGPIPGSARNLLCQVVWSDARLDVALLQLPESAAPALKVWGVVGARARETSVRMAAVATGRPLPHCTVTGFPRIQRYDGQKLDVDQYTGTVLPLAGLIRRTMVFEFDRPPAAEPADGTSPLAGLSGAPVYAGDTLLGVVREVPRGRNHHRVECVPISSVMAHPDVREWYEQHRNLRLPRLESLTHLHPGDSRYEEEYAEALAAEYRRTRIFGLDELSTRDSAWELETAYMSLEAVPQEGEGRAAHGKTSPQRVESLLGTRPRVLIRGDAGAGKTTLIKWLAAHAASGTLDSRLAELNGLVPFVVPLRSLRAQGGGFPGPDRLATASRLMVGEAPRGWARRVLEAGRALLLVDGLDEIPPQEREEARQRLSSLLELFPRTRCVATVRPLAVAPDWLESEDFAEVRLLPMRRDDIQAFITAWHAAARLDSEHPEDLVALERNLARQLTWNHILEDLARTPLLCAVICALHRKRDGFLPPTRWALYCSALELLLGERDKRRAIDAPEGITMTVDEHQQLLQRIAVWLIRGGQTEFTREQALHQLSLALRGMPRVREQGPIGQILTHLLNRSGLLQEQVEGVFQFTHRTFQDFLAAKEFVEGDQMYELLRHAHEEQWHDVLLLAAGHCSRRELPVLVGGLVAAGDAEPPGMERTVLHTLAALCAQHAAYLDEGTREKVDTAVRGALPPRKSGVVGLLSRLGTDVLPLLPDFTTLAPGDLGRTAALVGEIGGAAALPYAVRLAACSDYGPMAASLARTWANYPTEEYLQQVLLRIDLSNVRLYLTRPDQLPLLPLLPRAPHLSLTNDFPPAELAAVLEGRTCESLDLIGNRLLTDLTFLRSCGSGITEIFLSHCPGLESYAPLRECHSLRELGIGSQPISADDLRMIAGLPALSVLNLDNPVPAEGGLDLTPLHSVPGLEVFVLGVPEHLIKGREALGSRLILGF
ncbi:NACHT domain-containing protein [Streptomyces sp. NPDC051018]|uniref:NACHT domain-containing protein n=1 Tax=Streptomyces sp. NPDC051018 TaxID=3365639 RepID=UPI0037B2E8A0